MERLGDGAARVTVGQVHEAVGERGFGPLLLLPGLGALTPIGLIPGAPTAFAILTLLIAGQLIIGKQRFWIPRWLAERSTSGERLRKAMKVAKRPAGWLDRLLKPRLHALTGAAATRVCAAFCGLIALAVPPLELIPFGVAAPASAITAFGLGLTARDGLMVALALLASAVTVALLAWGLFLR